MFYSVVLFTPFNAQDPMTYCFQSLNLLVCEEVQVKEKEIDGTLSLVLSLPEGKCQQRNALSVQGTDCACVGKFFIDR